MNQETWDYTLVTERFSMSFRDLHCDDSLVSVTFHILSLGFSFIRGGAFLASGLTKPIECKIILVDEIDMKIRKKFLCVLHY